AETMAFRAILSIGRRFPHSSDDRQNAIADTEILTGAADVIHDIKASKISDSGLINSTGVFDVIKQTDACIFDGGKYQLAFERSSAELLLFATSLEDSRVRIFKTLSIYLRMGMASECSQFVAELREIARSLVVYNSEVMAYYLNIAECYQLALASKLDEAREKSVECLNKINHDTKEINPVDVGRILDELADFQHQIGYAKGEELTLESRLPLARRIESNYPGVSNNTAYALAKLYAKDGRYEKAIDLLQGALDLERRRDSIYIKDAQANLDKMTAQSQAKTRKAKPVAGLN
ncbi:MAG: hypothetical protein K2X81_25390, partial [Candidatus Obscuribacterales bacterium]|nr:hypothetical protein [Candidatus Obscuribacterales bacterium]